MTKWQVMLTDKLGLGSDINSCCPSVQCLSLLHWRLLCVYTLFLRTLIWEGEPVIKEKLPCSRVKSSHS